MRNYNLRDFHIHLNRHKRWGIYIKPNYVKLSQGQYEEMSH